MGTACSDQQEKEFEEQVPGENIIYECLIFYRRHDDDRGLVKNSQLSMKGSEFQLDSVT